MSFVLLFFATFGYVMLRALQQRNVAFDDYWWVPPCSFGMAALDVYCVVTIARGGWSIPVVLVNGSASALGCLGAMWFHRTFVKRIPSL